MADLVAAPEPAASRPGLLAPLTDPAGGPALTRLGAFARQGPVRRALPWFLGASAIGVSALAWAMLAPAPQRVLYAELDDAERASVVSALDKAGIGYTIDTCHRHADRRRGRSLQGANAGRLCRWAPAARWKESACAARANAN